MDSTLTWPLTLAYRLTGRFQDALALAKQGQSADPSFFWRYYSYVELAILYSELGREEEAGAAASGILKLVPDFSVEAHGERMPFKNPVQTERDMAALRKAGLK